MIVLVDSNEKATNPAIVKSLKKLFPKLKVTPLKFGDIQIVLDDGEIIAIERKKANDFLNSVGDGRVFRQVEKMSKGAKWSCIIIEGKITFDKNDMVVADKRETGWKGKSIRAALFAIQFSGCPVLQTNTEYFPNAVAEIIRFCTKPSIHAQKLEHKRIVTFPPVELSVDILCSFPGVGLKSAMALKEFAAGNHDDNFGSLAESMCWVTSFPLISPNDRPVGWGSAMIANFRTALGLHPWEFLDIKVDEKIKKEMQSGRKK